MIDIDVLKINHWLNARKITLLQVKNKNKKLYNKIKKKKNFSISTKELSFLKKYLNIQQNDILLKKKLPDFIYFSKKKILSTKRPIKRDSIHFYNYYTLPSPQGFKSPVILDILCPHYKVPKLNNGHLEQAITVNLGPGDIYGRWGENIKKKENFSIIKSNKSKNNWIVGDTYLEPTYLSHSYSLVDKTPSQILSYTAKSQLQKFSENSNIWPNQSYKNMIKAITKNGQKITFIKSFLNSRGLDINYISKKLRISKKQIENFLKSKKISIKNKKILEKICKIMNVEPSIFNESKFNEDRVGKTYKSYKDCFKSIRKFKSYLVSSMSASEKYPDLFGIFMKVSKKKMVKDLEFYASTHYLATSGKMFFYIKNKKIRFENGDSIWIAPFLKHGFSGDGSIIKISNGECIDYQDINEINNLFDYKKTLKRIYKDNINWGYDT
tara:strand:+ start:316 stop:1632 length:1317 start_codon:yes stop_codon:yes gene_type:complete